MHTPFLLYNPLNLLEDMFEKITVQQVRPQKETATGHHHLHIKNHDCNDNHNANNEDTNTSKQRCTGATTSIL